MSQKLTIQKSTRDGETSNSDDSDIQIEVQTCEKSDLAVTKLTARIKALSRFRISP